MRRSNNRFAASDAARRKKRRVDRPMEGTVEASTRQTKTGPEVFADDALTVFSAALGNALQKLLGRPVVAEDRIFHFDPERQRASLELPSLRPPQQLSCAVEMEEDVQFSELTNSEQVTLRQSVEHKISKLMLKELESEGLLTFDTSQPPLHAWVPGKDAQRVALIPRAQRRVKIVPPRVTKASATGVKTGEPVFMRLRKLQDSFAANPPEEYKEQIIFRPSAPSEPWYATVLLKSSAGERLEGSPRSSDQGAVGQVAQEPFTIRDFGTEAARVQDATFCAALDTARRPSTKRRPPDSEKQHQLIAFHTQTLNATSRQPTMHRRDVVRRGPHRHRPNPSECDLGWCPEEFCWTSNLQMDFSATEPSNVPDATCQGSATSSTTARAEAALQELESDEEGVAWDSDSHKESHKDDLDEGSDSDDEGPPPLQLLPDSEE
eukprot:symbB.v1.2.003366.t2/scaffold189.1/size277183/3